jgi:hypothetical protein
MRALCNQYHYEPQRNVIETHSFNRKMWIDTPGKEKMTQTSARWIICQHCNGLETIKDGSGQYRDFDVSEGKGGWFEPKPMSAKRGANAINADGAI